MERKTTATLLALSFLSLGFIVWISRQKVEAPAEIPGGKAEVTNFEECAAAGYPVGESFPLQCFADGQTFTEEIVNDPEEDDEEVMDPLTESEALELAKKECPAEVVTWGPGSYNEETETWWFDVTLKEPKSGCNPACVVDDLTGEVEVNWRCTGLLPDSDTTPPLVPGA